MHGTVAPSSRKAHHVRDPVNDEVGPSPRRGRAAGRHLAGTVAIASAAKPGAAGFAARDFSDELQFLGFDGFLDFLCVCDLLRGVADEQRRPAD